MGGVSRRELGLLNPQQIREVQIRAFAQGFVYKGGIRIDPPNQRHPVSPETEASIKCLYVNGSDEKTGLGVVYTGMLAPMAQPASTPEPWSTDKEADYRHGIKGLYLQRDEKDQ